MIALIVTLFIVEVYSINELLSEENFYGGQITLINWTIEDICCGVVISGVTNVIYR